MRRAAFLFGRMAVAGSEVFETLTRRHGGAGEVVGFDSVLSAARMNSAIVMFLSTVEKAN